MLYDIYPNKCFENPKRRLKSRKSDTSKIKTLLRSGKVDVINIMLGIYAEVIKSKFDPRNPNAFRPPLKQFSTFLNNIPDIDEDEYDEVVLEYSRLMGIESENAMNLTSGDEITLEIATSLSKVDDKMFIVVNRTPVDGCDTVVELVGKPSSIKSIISFLKRGEATYKFVSYNV